ncbi:MAG: hypothetical protein LBJ69_01210 [Holosporales bacterium]|nr:hypothetical protein [Holosporales bacterium]
MKSWLAATMVAFFVMGGAAKAGGFGGGMPLMQQNRAVVLLSDKTSIDQNAIDKEIKNLPREFVERMTIAQLTTFVATLLTVRYVAAKVLANVQFDKAEQAKIEQRRRVVLANLFTQYLITQAMTFEALKKHYDKACEKMKDQDAFDILVIVMRDRSLVASFQQLKTKTKDSIEKHAQQSGCQVTEAPNQLLQSFPALVAKGLTAAKAGDLVGPFPGPGGGQVLFFVTGRHKFKPTPFTQAMVQRYMPLVASDFTKTALERLHKIYETMLWDVYGKEADVLHFADKPSATDDKDIQKISKLKDDFVLAQVKIDGKEKKITVHDLKGYYGVESLVDGPLVEMSRQYGMSLAMVMVYAVKVVIEEMIILAECSKQGYDKKPEIKTRVDQEAMDVKFQMHVLKHAKKPTEAEAKLAFIRDMKAIPPEMKNDHLITFKMIFFNTQEDATKGHKDIMSTPQKFNTMFEGTPEDNRLELKRAGRQNLPPAIWEIVKDAPPGACCKKIVEHDGRWAVVFITDRKPVPQPAWSQPQVRQDAINRLIQQYAVLYVCSLLVAHVISINGQMIAALIQTVAFQALVGAILGSARM